MAASSACPVRARPSDWVGLRVERDPARYRQVVARGRAIGPIANAHVVYWLMRDAAEGEDQEVFWVILLDTHGLLRGVQEVARGSRDRVGVEIPDALRAAVIAGTRYFVVVHNHPSGNGLRPSKPDADLTYAIARAGAYVGLLLVDHVVIGLGEYYSFRENQAWTVRS